MNATTPPLTRSRVLEPSAGTRRWLALLLGVEGLAALAATVTSISLAPDAAALVPTFGATGQVALLLLAGAGAVISIMAFTTAAAIVRRRDGAAGAAASVQLTLVAAALFAGLVDGFNQQIVAGLLVAGIGLFMAALIARR
jgi:hypothetical protein